MSEKPMTQDWVLVPREPADQMLRAAQTAWLADPLRKTTTLWYAMIEAAPPAPGGWMPIETAPKDGTEIWVGDHETGCVAPVTGQIWWYGEWQNSYTGHSIGFKPTHWQPLPLPPPAVEGQG